MKKTLTVIIFALLTLASVLFICGREIVTPIMALEIRRPVEKQAKDFIERTVKKIEPVLKEDAKAYWNATTTGKKEFYTLYEEKEIEFKKIMSDPLDYAEIRDLKDNYKKSLSRYPEYDPKVDRQLRLLYLDYLENQIDPKLSKALVRMGSALEEKFNTHRAKIDGKEAPDNKIREIMRRSVDLTERQKVWEASKQIGDIVNKDLIALVKKRNEAARALGFKNFYVMRLELQEQDEKELFSLLDDMASLTKAPYKDVKSEIDASLAKRYNIKVSELRPWHYEDPFFQEAPQVYNLNLDKYFKDKDIIKLVNAYYGSIGMPVEDILKRSDLYEKKGKEQHAYCINIDRNKDIRILANVKPDEYWAGTMLHELGHAVYEKYFDNALPYLLREPSHTFTTEGIAELFGRQTTNAAWLTAAVDPKKKAEFEKMASNLKRSLRAKMLIFSRWVMVMANFERALYANPDQDLNDLWWDLVEKYQLIKRPEGRFAPDWAAKIHLSSSPVYYHNYLLGELLGSQLTHYINKNIIKGDEAFVNNKKLGEYLKAKVFAPGDRLRWDEFVKEATGEPLTPKYFAEQFL